MEVIKFTTESAAVELLEHTFPFAAGKWCEQICSEQSDCAATFPPSGPRKAFPRNSCGFQRPRYLRRNVSIFSAAEAQ